MIHFILDTSFLLHLIRNTQASQTAIANHKIMEPNTLLICSVVTAAEIRVLAKNNHWGCFKIAKNGTVYRRSHGN